MDSACAVFDIQSNMASPGRHNHVGRNKVSRHFTIVLEVVMFVNSRCLSSVPFYALVYKVTTCITDIPCITQGMWVIHVITYTCA